ncbi:dDENN domain-containing protein [Cynara cardunculus var. scolymus]|uniref:DDENN domain-containing protein n=1 Tax=Cynara cardunculus var. scolymus TaxID=59895 RepID=A0A124SFN9_CYNCS|nr:dDENN domain-containing protein [Cynara cardunculus var. scolymus]
MAPKTQGEHIEVLEESVLAMRADVKALCDSKAGNTKRIDYLDKGIQAIMGKLDSLFQAKSDNSSVFQMHQYSYEDLNKVADNATLYGICLQTQDFVQRPPGMLGTASSLARASRGGSPKLNDQAVECTDDTSKELSWMDSAIPVDNELAISPPSAAAAVIIDNVISSPSRLETGSPSSAVFRDKSFNKEIQTETVGRKDLPDLDDSNHDALEKRWEYLGKMHGDYETVRREYVEACVFPPSQTLERLGSSGPLFSSVKGVVSEDEDVVLSCSDKDAINKAIMEWARIVCGYHALPVPSYGGKIVFRPLEHLQTIEYYRTAFSFGEDPKEQILDIPDKILILLAGVLLEKQVIITSPNLGVLSATVLSLIPMILPFEWQSLFLPVLPGKMFDFLDAPVPFVVGILHKPADNKIKTSNLVHVDLTHNEVEISSLPPFPKLRELITRLGPLHARLAADKSAIRKHPVYRLNKFQNEAAAQFLTVLRQHLESLCTNLSSHAITSVQSDDDRVSLLMKESYIDSFPARDRPFIRQFVDTQMFTVLSDTRLSRIQNLT